jgi:phage repressor protein C with HTH and peptisase S24 domain
MSSRVKSGDMLIVSTGVGEVGNGGVIVICDDAVVQWSMTLEDEQRRALGN